MCQTQKCGPNPMHRWSGPDTVAHRYCQRVSTTSIVVGGGVWYFHLLTTLWVEGLGELAQLFLAPQKWLGVLAERQRGQ